MKNKFKILALALVAVMSLAGCGTQTAAPITSSEPSSSSSEVVVSSEPVVTSSTDVTSEVPASVDAEIKQGTSSQPPVSVTEKTVQSNSQQSATAASKTVEPPPVPDETKATGYGSEEHRQKIYETEWLDHSKNQFYGAYDTFDAYYNAFYILPYEGLGTPHMKTQEERNAEAKQNREARIKRRAEAETSAMQYLQSHWTEEGKTQAEIDARKAEWKAIFKAIDDKEKALLAQGLSKSEVEGTIGIDEQMAMLTADFLLATPEEVEEAKNWGANGFTPVGGAAAAGGTDNVSTPEAPGGGTGTGAGFAPAG